MKRRAQSLSLAGESNEHPTSIHYDNEVEFFRGFLDPYMKYTSGLYLSPDDGPDVAMVNMLDKHIELAGLEEGARVLDIGCGWGSLLKRLRETHPRVAYTGVTPSPNQMRFIRENIAPAADLVQGAFENEIGITPAYDAVFLSGVFCHLRDKRSQLSRVAALLKPGGVIVLEDTFFLTDALFQKHGQHPKTRFVQRDIFGFAEIHSIGSHFDMVGDSGLKVSYCLENSLDYRRTIAAWIERLQRMDPKAFPLAAEYVRYMSYAQEGWSYTTVNYVMSLRRARTFR